METKQSILITKKMKPSTSLARNAKAGSLAKKEIYAQGSISESVKQEWMAKEEGSYEDNGMPERHAYAILSRSPKGKYRCETYEEVKTMRASAHYQMSWDSDTPVVQRLVKASGKIYSELVKIEPKKIKVADDTTPSWESLVQNCIEWIQSGTSEQHMDATEIFFRMAKIADCYHRENRELLEVGELLFEALKKTSATLCDIPAEDSKTMKAKTRAAKMIMDALLKSAEKLK